MAILIVGLGPADGRLLTREAWQVLERADTIVLRTSRHPAAADLPDTAKVLSLDDIYESGGSFADVYEAITEKILSLGRVAAAEQGDIVYAVPGHPLVGESTVASIKTRAMAEGLVVQIIDGLSFVEPTLVALDQDALEGLQLFDALEIARYNHPPLNSDLPVLLGQLYSRLVAGEVKLALMALYPDDHEVMLVHGAGTAEQRVERVPLYEIDRSERIGHLTSLYLPPLPHAGSISALAETVAHLRGPEGCPWDQEQTSHSLRAGFLEEASEVLQAIDEKDSLALREELGDMFYHLVMQTQIAVEQEAFRLDEVLGGIIAKLKRRHPHVWGDLEVSGSAEVIRNWEAIKDEENHGSSKGESVLNSVPTALPALARAQTLQRRAGKVGFDWPTIEGVEAKVREELAEMRQASTSTALQMELGDLLFALVNWARWLDVDSESALREANRRFERRFRLVERLAIERGLSMASMPVEAMNDLWEEAKAALSANGSSDSDAAHREGLG